MIFVWKRKPNQMTLITDSRKQTGVTVMHTQIRSLMGLRNIFANQTVNHTWKTRGLSRSTVNSWTTIFFPSQQRCTTEQNLTSHTTYKSKEPKTQIQKKNYSLQHDTAVGAARTRGWRRARPTENDNREPPKASRREA